METKAGGAETKLKAVGLPQFGLWVIANGVLTGWVIATGSTNMFAGPVANVRVITWHVRVIVKVWVIDATTG
jgi:hypothetical protein